MKNIIPVDDFTDPVTVLEDGDPVVGGSSEPTAQALTNRTHNLNLRLIALTADVAADLAALEASLDADIADVASDLAAFIATKNQPNGFPGLNGSGNLVLATGLIQATTGQVIANTGLKAKVAGAGSDAIDGFISKGSIVPTLTSVGGSIGGSPTYGRQVLTYTRIGSLVFFDFQIYFSGSTGSSGSVALGTLPYSIRNRSNNGPAYANTGSNGITIGSSYGTFGFASNPPDHIIAYPGSANGKEILFYSTAGGQTQWTAIDSNLIRLCGHGFYHTDDAF